MKIKSHKFHDINIAEIISEELIITSEQDGLDLLGDLYYQGFDKVILHEKNIIPEFFDLKTGIAGEVLQKFSNYRMSLVIVGNFEKYQSKSLKQFILESNRTQSINFVENLDDALK